MRVHKARTFLGRFRSGTDLLDELNLFCVRHKIELGFFSVIGALTKARLGYYEQQKKRYVTCVELKKKLEITSCTGNISLKDGRPFVHAHVTLADLRGRCYGGHLMRGAKIFAAEYLIAEYKGGRLEREFDPQTGLQLWPLKT